MKILVMSDSHGDGDAVTSVLKRCEHNIDMFVFLGDGVRDALFSASLFPGIPRVIVRGNCDAFLAPSSEYPDEMLFEADGIRFLAVHGHMQCVKYGVSDAARYAAQKGASVLLFGHTHARCDKTVETPDGEVRAINPGSIRSWDGCSFALVETVRGTVVCGFGEL